MRTATRMMMMSGRGKNNGEERGGERSSYGQNGRGGMPQNERYGQEFERGEMGGGMNRESWPKNDRRKEREGRYKAKNENWREGKYEDDDDDDDEEGGGKYAGKFRHRKDQGEHEAGQAVEFDEQKAKKWVQGMKNGDGSTGEHFKSEQAEQLRTTHCPQCNKTEFWATMNMMYSDYCEAAKKMNVDKPEFYACMAKAFLMDEDAGENKLAKYMKYIAEK